MSIIEWFAAEYKMMKVRLINFWFGYVFSQLYLNCNVFQMLMGQFIKKSHKIFRSRWILYYLLFLLQSNLWFIYLFILEGGEGSKIKFSYFFFLYFFNGIMYLLLSYGQVIWPVLDALQAVFAWALILSQYPVFLIALCKSPQLRGV
jgi:hypothetical protein